MSGLPYLDAATLERLVPMGRAVAVLEEALRAGLDPEATPQRPVVDVPAGQLLLMPAATRRYAGVKAVSIAPANPERGLPRIQGTYLLFDGDTLAPLAAMDGIALTSLRTPAVSALAVRHLAEPGARRLVVFGSGPQAYGHVPALREVRPVEDVTVVGRDAGRAEAL
ncbi:ornithine cyclodeaminase family protein, partial [Nonomuraea maheshkhaliensis]|uniref:ornithine cyclodeaminase family protein n=1 Tax=Nonomuraea maheshkhaliensis TaxID=419590 RepID=UPI003D15D9AD